MAAFEDPKAPPTHRVWVVLLSALVLFYSFSAATRIEISSHQLSRNQRYHSRLSWGHRAVPGTKLMLHAPGWTLFDQLYLLNGTLYIITDQPEHLPDTKFIMSTGLHITNGEENAAALLPTEKELRIITRAEAKSIFGAGANRIEGVTWLANDPDQFLRSHLHFAAELLLGFWRAYAALDPFIPTNGITRLPPPRRLIFPNFEFPGWRDPGMKNPYVLRSATTSVLLEYKSDWADRATFAPNVAFMFDRVLIADRSAAGLGNAFMSNYRTASSAMDLPGSPFWWKPLRENVVRTSGLDDAALKRTSKPVITYISRQGLRLRSLRREDHEKLVQELNTLGEAQGYEVNVVRSEDMTPAEEVRLLGRSTVALGVHGPGLVPLIWMGRMPQSTVLEFFYPQGFSFEYAYTARALGLSYIGFWENSTFAYPDIPRVAYPPGSHGTGIPIDGALVAKIIQERLSSQ
ncbi:unnamed protein product [Peniophora sp. CBMAI 1063]|nr:unnamed protein product [Peniophora sp. CBMAI 1063]